MSELKSKRAPAVDSNPRAWSQVYDDINDIKDDLKEVGELLEVLNNNNNDVNDIKEHLKTDWSKIDDINIDLFYDKYNLCLVNKVIEEIIIKLNNDNV